MDLFRRTMVTIPRTRLVAIAAAIVMFVALSPLAGAVSMVSQAEVEEDDNPARVVAITSLTHDEIQFLEDNWLFDAASLQPEVVAEADQDWASILKQSRIQFEEDNWHFNSGAMMIEAEEAAGQSADSPAAIRERTEFLEGNWHLNFDDVFSNPESGSISSAPLAEMSIQHRAAGITLLRTQHLDAFDAMERDPGLYTGQAGLDSILQERAGLIDELAQLNVAEFETMSEAPALFTGN